MAERKSRPGLLPLAPRKSPSVRLELDLPHELLLPSPIPLLGTLTRFLREQEVEEEGSLLVRVGELLHELGEDGFSRVDHWQVEPGGWLPLPEATHESHVEPLGHLARALRDPAWTSLGSARGFAFRLSGPHDRRVDAEVLHRHRERQHSITLVLWGPPTTPDLRRLVRRLRSRFAPLKIRLRR